MTHRLQGLHALVTGGGRGIGRQIALQVAGEGCSVAVAARTAPEIEQVAEECRALGVEAVALTLDVTDTAAVRRAVAQVEERWGGIDVLVNNAGVAASHKFTDLSDEEWERIFAVNVTAPFYLTRAALPSMLARGSGAVIAISSIAARVGGPYIAAYSASKHALLGMMRSLAAEYPRSGVTFNCVCPAYVETSMTDRTIATIMHKTGRSAEEATRALLTPQGRLVRPEEVAAVCVLLASLEGRGINGQAINVDGGMVQS